MCEKRGFVGEACTVKFSTRGGRSWSTEDLFDFAAGFDGMQVACQRLRPRQKRIQLRKRDLKRMAIIKATVEVG